MNTRMLIRNNNRGFTLIEMLVVVMIMGLFVALVSAIVQPDDRALLRIEAERLAQLLDLAAAKSRLTGKRIAWTTDGTGYQFWQFSEDGHWLEIRDDDLLRARTLPQDMTIAGISIENTRSQEKMPLEFHPYVPALSFTIEIRYGIAHATVMGSPVGEIRALPPKGTNE